MTVKEEWIRERIRASLMQSVAMKEAGVLSSVMAFNWMWSHSLHTDSQRQENKNLRHAPFITSILKQIRHINVNIRD